MTAGHLEHEDHAWTVRIADHPQRTESAEFRAAKKAAHAILAEMPAPPFGPGPWQMHHGGSIWVHDGTGWACLMSIAGIEWSMQFCADAAKVDGLRALALAVVGAFPDTLPNLQRIGYHRAADLLNTPIVDAAGVAAWTDGLFNSCVPLPAPIHTGVLPHGGGYHHYPKPIVDAELFKRDDWPLWVDGLAVVPTERGDGSVEVVHAPADHPLAAHHAACHADGRRHVLPAGHDTARRAHARVPQQRGA